MLDLLDIKETIVYQEAYEKDKLEGMFNGIEIVLDNKFGNVGMCLVTEIGKNEGYV